MELTLDEIKPFLSERGALELELAAQRAVVAKLTALVQHLTSTAEDGTTAPSE